MVKLKNCCQGVNKVMVKLKNCGSNLYFLTFNLFYSIAIIPNFFSLIDLQLSSQFLYSNPTHDTRAAILSVILESVYMQLPCLCFSVVWLNSSLLVLLDIMCLALPALPMCPHDICCSTHITTRCYFV
jgi:hypothetical protein